MGWGLSLLVGKPDLVHIFDSDFSIGYQLLVGLIYGLAIGWTTLEIGNSRYMKSAQDRYQQRYEHIRISSWWIVIFVSICAGVGEELFFRGVLQSYWGIPITSVVFVAIHAYVYPLTFKWIILAAYLVLIIIGLGILFESTGIIAPIVAHTVYDIIILGAMKKSRSII